MAGNVAAVTLRVAHRLLETVLHPGETALAPVIFSLGSVEIWAGFSSHGHQALNLLAAQLAEGRTVPKDASSNLSGVKMVFSDSVGQEIMG